MAARPLDAVRGVNTAIATTPYRTPYGEVLMPSPNETKGRILQSLRHGPLDVQELAKEIESSPFMTEAYLKDLRRDRLAEIWAWTAGPPTYILTAKGLLAAAAVDQLRLV